MLQCSNAPLEHEKMYKRLFVTLDGTITLSIRTASCTNVMVINLKIFRSNLLPCLLIEYNYGHD